MIVQLDILLMNFNFELILFYATIICGVIALIDSLFFAKKRKASSAVGEIKLPMIVDYARSFFPILLIVFFLRSFLYEPFRIPSGSLMPSLLIGDFLIVNKFDYGIRLPVIHTKIINRGEPERGDIVVFRHPPDPSKLLIKRVIGVPGDRIDYVNKVLYINGKKIPQEFKQYTVSQENGVKQDVEEKAEDLLGKKHLIYQNVNQPGFDYHNIVVPNNMYFMMGDNRDDSADSRYWGFMPEENIVGKAVRVWMSWDSLNNTIRWNRLGKRVS